MTTSLIIALLSTLTVNISNPLSEPRENEPVVIPIPESFGNVQSVIVSDANIPYQIDDMNSDGVADEVVLMLNLTPKENKTISVTFSTEHAENGDKETTPGTNAYLKLNDKNKKYPRITAITYPGDVDNRQMYNSIYGHGAVLEGLYNAIRVYMDNRQSVDLYAKNTPKLELETTGFYTTADQMKKGYGRDILWAGTSVAMGSFRGWQNEQPVTIDTVTTRGQRVVTTGPLRSVIEVTDKGWIYNGKPVDMTQCYTMYKGHRDYDVEIRIKNVSDSEVFATGIQKIMNDNVGFINKDGLAASWGNNLPDKSMPEVTDTLGLGISVRSPYLLRTVEDDINYLTILKPDENGTIKYSITAAALRDETSPRNAEEWFRDVKAWRKKLDNPIKVTVKSAK